MPHLRVPSGSALCAGVGQAVAALVTRRTWRGKGDSVLAGSVTLLYVSSTDLKVEVCSSPQDVSDSNEFLNK